MTIKLFGVSTLFAIAKWPWCLPLCLEKSRLGGNVGHDLVGGRDPGGYYLVGGAGYEFVGYE